MNTVNVWNPDVWNPNFSEFWTFVHSIFWHIRCLISKQKLLDFRHFTKVSKIWTKFQISKKKFWSKVCLKSELFGKWTVIEWVKSIVVWISDTYCWIEWPEINNKFFLESTCLTAVVVVWICVLIVLFYHSFAHLVSIENCCLANVLKKIESFVLNVT